MSQLTELTTFLKTHLPERVKEFDSYMDEIRLVMGRKDGDRNREQTRIGLTTYDGVVMWDKWPYRVCDPAHLYALVLIWRDEHAADVMDDTGVADPDLDVEVVDEESAIINITIPMAEEILIQPDPDGTIPYAGRMWQIATPLIDIAEGALITGADGTPAEVDDASAGH
ncbi:phage tail protein [Sodalis sp. RH18]|uniref:phage tail protein n=1 Tax=Sodalis sp. RH18 TaxID=3394333 RepID=UPI0039B3F11D